MSPINGSLLGLLLSILIMAYMALLPEVAIQFDSLKNLSQTHKQPVSCQPISNKLIKQTRRSSSFGHHHNTSALVILGSYLCFYFKINIYIDDSGQMTVIGGQSAATPKWC